MSIPSESILDPKRRARLIDDAIREIGKEWPHEEIETLARKYREYVLADQSSPMTAHAAKKSDAAINALNQAVPGPSMAAALDWPFTATDGAPPSRVQELKEKQAQAKKQWAKIFEHTQKFQQIIPARDISRSANLKTETNAHGSPKKRTLQDCAALLEATGQVPSATRKGNVRRLARIIIELATGKKPQTLTGTKYR